MSCETYLLGTSWLRRLDPRGRVLFLAAFALVVAVLPHPRAAAVALGMAMGLSAAADLPWLALARRLRALNALMLTLALLLPLRWEAGAVVWDREGLALAGLIALKANAISLVATALVSTLEPVHLGHTLARLGAPAKLVQLLVFTLRYLDELTHARHRLSDALRVRAFRPRLDGHTLRSYGYGLGMLLVGAFDRSERILAAMRCRGFDGRFHTLDTFAPGARDAAFALLGLALLGTLGWLGWM